MYLLIQMRALQDFHRSFPFQEQELLLSKLDAWVDFERLSQPSLPHYR